MSIETDFDELFTQTVTITPRIASDQYGQPLFGEATNYTARTVHKNRMVRDAQGKEAISTATTWIKGLAGVTPKDKIVLPDGSSPVILAVERYPDENGDHHEKVMT